MENNSNNIDSYANKVIKTAKYIYAGATEIIPKQFILDPIQDTILSKLVFSFMSLGAKVIVAPSGCFSCNVIFSGVSKGTHLGCAKMENMQFCGVVNKKIPSIMSNPIDEFMKEFAIHAVIKITSTVIFPLGYSAYNIVLENGNEITNGLSYGVKSITKYVGINPLEGIFAISNIIPEDNIIRSNFITDWIKNNYIKARAVDPLYEQVSKDYDLYMEAVDGLSHFADHMKAIITNLNSPYMYVKVPIMAAAFYALSYNTQEKENKIDQEVDNFRGLLDNDAAVCYGENNEVVDC
jgi:hypothetical protein